MLYKQQIKIDDKKFDATPLENIYVAKTNQKLFGLPIHRLVWLYYAGENHFKPEKFIQKKEKKEKKFDGKIKAATSQKKVNNLQYRKLRKTEAFNKKIENGNNFMQWGEKLSVYDSASTQLTQEKIQGYLFANGYFLNQVEAGIAADNRKMQVLYSVRLNKPYRLDSVTYYCSDTQISKLIAKDAANQNIKRGMIYNQESFGKERERIELLLRDNGYYSFSRQFIDFAVDTTVVQPQRVTVHVNIRIPANLKKHLQFRIDSLHFTPDVGVKVDSGMRRNTQRYRGINFHNYTNRFHKKVLRQRVFIFHDSLYSRSQTFLTQKQLANLDIFKFVNINYDTSGGKFVANIFGSPQEKYSWGNEAGVSVTQGFPGPYYSLNFKQRNLFGGLEIFELNGRFGLEGVASATSIGNFYKSTEANLNASITLPQFLFPFKGNRSTQLAKFNPRTRLLAGYTYTDRPEYNRSIITASATYTWENTKSLLFSFSPLNLNVIRSDTTAAFGAILRDLESKGNRLINAFKPSYVSSMLFSVTWNQHNYGGNVNSFFVRAALESGGTMLNFWTPSLIKKEGLQPYQFVRANVDLRRTQIAGKNAQVAMRVNAGIGYAYSSNKVLPYEKNFFVGGSNSVRAWRPRRLGQGSATPDSSANPRDNGLFNYRFEKPGDILLEGSLEWRQKLFGFINYAFFVDVGNVWSIRSNSDSKTKFTTQFFKEFGVGTGVGLRFDFTFLILRLDVGMKVYDPARPEGDKFVLNKVKFFKPFGTEREPVIFNIGIGYPF